MEDLEGEVTWEASGGEESIWQIERLEARNRGCDVESC